ncbi:LacI family gluconate utilization system Gnt-I transcriptional repressor [Pseudomonas sp. BIGb0408]|uniref:LacI family gluconate utilization system Gnt-I transcriptional repressor n=1 Tax=Phytopseudomonas flavescens TaxID=29435 RepID=A0A7Z0BNQ7_9GAMM|nr:MULTISPECIES: LacI family DNA-binding transcriptional regulator [Pseudomonas]MCW2293320.1 LacI family gluconate utilization system Gnt-I transcriptional repressor [Pseudomonas sp. BIGb0408]NYH72109.1 LacI family gluconate utilization system Gnt-I transcriptional repressor [Pseudomonas flavescens]
MAVKGAGNSGRSTQGVTLIDVAKAAGVAPMTVSRALNNPDHVKKATLLKVRKAIEDTGYVRNLVAGALASNRSHLVAVIVPILTNPIFSDTFQAIADRLSQSGYQVLLGMSGYQPDQEQELLEVILSRRPDGIILTGTLHTEASRRRLRAVGVPVVETWDLTSDPIDMLVGFCHEDIGRDVARHLLGKGYADFATLGVNDPRGQRRLNAFVEELQANGIHEVTGERIEGVPTLEHGRSGLRKLLANPARPLVVVCSSDTLAHGVLTEALAQGIRVPDEVAVMGFGDMNFAAHTHPALSTVKIDGKVMGDAAASALLDRLLGNGDEIVQRDIGYRLIDRQSTR